MQPNGVVSDGVDAGGHKDVPALLAACVSLYPDASLVSRLARLPDAEWERLVRRAHRQGLAPLLHRSLTTVAAPGVVPSRVERTLAAEYERSKKEGVELRGELSTILEAFGVASVPVVVLKGAYLAEAVYGDPAVRPMADIDVLVRQSDLGRAERTLLDLGYCSEDEPDVAPFHALDCHLPPFYKLASEEIRAALPTYGLDLRRPDLEGAVKVEVHWSIEGQAAPGGRPVVYRPHPIDIDLVWTRVEPVRLAGRDALALAPEDVLLHLALHYAFHEGFYGSLKKVCDVGWTAHRHGARIDWERVRAAARASRAEKFVHVVLRLARAMHGPVIPAEAVKLQSWTDVDERAYEAILTYVLRYPERYSVTWRRMRAVIDPWWRGVSGVTQRARGQTVC